MTTNNIQDHPEKPHPPYDPNQEVPPKTPPEKPGTKQGKPEDDPGRSPR